MGLSQGARPRMTRFRLALASVFLSVAATAAGAQSHLLIVSGLGGERQYSDAFYEWAITMADAAKARHGLAPDRIIYLAEDPARDTARIQGKSTGAEIRAAIQRIARASEPGDQVFILLLGHGTSTGQDAK